jgi:hypothetical protein
MLEAVALNPATFQQPTPVQSQNFGTLNEKSLNLSAAPLQQKQILFKNLNQ